MANYMKILKNDLVNGEGIRVSLFFSGCNHHCNGCFNKEAWDFNCGKPFTEKTIDSIINLMDKPYIKGLSILGGEPFDNYEDLENLCKIIKEKFPNKNIWIWTGYLFENIMDKEVLSYVDAIVDGPFIEEQKNLTLAFRGSENQRIWRKIESKWQIEN